MPGMNSGAMGHSRTRQSTIFPPTRGHPRIAGDVGSAAGSGGRRGLAGPRAVAAGVMLVAAGDWAAVPVAADPAFREVFVRTANSGT